MKQARPTWKSRMKGGKAAKRSKKKCGGQDGLQKRGRKQYLLLQHLGSYKLASLTPLRRKEKKRQWVLTLPFSLATLSLLF